MHILSGALRYPRLLLWTRVFHAEVHGENAPTPYPFFVASFWGTSARFPCSFPRSSKVHHSLCFCRLSSNFILSSAFFTLRSSAVANHSVRALSFASCPWYCSRQPFIVSFWGRHFQTMLIVRPVAQAAKAGVACQDDGNCSTEGKVPIEGDRNQNRGQHTTYLRGAFVAGDLVVQIPDLLFLRCGERSWIRW